TEHEIFPVRPAAPVAPVNPAAVARTLGKLRGGKPVTIAVTGASIELGAEAPAWWADLWTEKNLGYASRVIVELRRRFPKSAITGVDAFQGGTTTEYGLKVIEEKVLPSKADLLLVGFGGNDCAGPEGGKPNNPPEKYKEDMRAIIGKAKGAGMDVIIVVTMQQNPWLAPGKRWPAYREKLLELSKEENVALADVYTEWLNQATRGVPPFSQLHNWLNHPGKDGHKVYADTVLRFFEAR
ncbi:MAG TPA: GDSL-type esterase/lipase family protein, partial [Phycisphaerae bacterium]|nr:GDSL-type esterase/lipase family protein [Phycisphaerae bacterium]